MPVCTNERALRPRDKRSDGPNYLGSNEGFADDASVSMPLGDCAVHITGHERKRHTGSLQSVRNRERCLTAEVDIEKRAIQLQVWQELQSFSNRLDKADNLAMFQLQYRHKIVGDQRLVFDHQNSAVR